MAFGNCEVVRVACHARGEKQTNYVTDKSHELKAMQERNLYSQSNGALLSLVPGGGGHLGIFGVGMCRPGLKIGTPF